MSCIRRLLLLPFLEVFCWYTLHTVNLHRKSVPSRKSILDSLNKTNPPIPDPHEPPPYIRTFSTGLGSWLLTYQFPIYVPDPRAQTTLQRYSTFSDNEDIESASLFGVVARLHEAKSSQNRLRSVHTSEIRESVKQYVRLLPLSSSNSLSPVTSNLEKSQSVGQYQHRSREEEHHRRRTIPAPGYLRLLHIQEKS